MSRLASHVDHKKPLLQRVREDKWYLLFILPVAILVILFAYLPIYGIVIAFQDYQLGDALLSFDGSTVWVGLKHFKRFVTSMYFGRTLGNTLRLSFLGLLFGCWIPMAVALLLNEIKISSVKRTLQTVYYLPYFMSTAVVVSILTLMFGSQGPISMLGTLFGHEAKDFLADSRYFDFIYVGSGIWQSFGYGSIIYMAAIAGVDPSLYEAVMMDGGNRWHRLRHVTLPAILPTFVIILVLSAGGIMGSDTEKILLLDNVFIRDRAEVIGTYVYRRGLIDSQLSFSAAVGLFTNVINFCLVFFANRLSRRLTGWSLW